MRYYWYILYTTCLYTITKSLYTMSYMSYMSYMSFCVSTFRFYFSGSWSCDRGWSPDKKAWCCHHAKVACPELPPFDCDSQYDHWQVHLFRLDDLGFFLGYMMKTKGENQMRKFSVDFVRWILPSRSYRKLKQVFDCLIGIVEIDCLASISISLTMLSHCCILDNNLPIHHCRGFSNIASGKPTSSVT